MWNGTILSNTTTPVYLGIHLDRTLCYKMHIETTKIKVNARNNIIRKPANSKWGCKASTLRPSCLALCYSCSCRIRLLCVGKVYTRAHAEPGPTRLLPNHLGLPQSNELVYTYWPESPLHTSGGLLSAAWNVHAKRQMPDTNYSITNQLLVDASCAQSRRSTRLQAAADGSSGNTA